jgi:DNA-directed RNA polymerase specialized sigma24 family protein
MASDSASSRSEEACGAGIPVPGAPNYVFATWRAALQSAQDGIESAYAYRRRLVRQASDAGLSYREIGEGLGLSSAAVGKIMGRSRAGLDDPIDG